MFTPVFCLTKPTQKILVSPGYGAGWVTWVDQLGKHPRSGNRNYAFVAWMITYQPIIDRIEEDTRFSRSISRRTLQACGTDKHDEICRWREYGNMEWVRLLARFDQEAREKFGVEGTYHNGARTLRVVEVGGPFMLMEDDGAESVIELGNQETILLG